MIVTCPPPETLRSYLLGECEEYTGDEIEQHLERCKRCESTLAELDTAASDSLLRHLPLAASQPAEPQPSARGWLDRLRQGPPIGAPANPTTPEELQEPLDQQSNYELLGVLGRGGMGVVYRGRHRRLNRLVALKVVNPRLLESPQARRRFEREIRILGSLKHPGIVMATDAGRFGSAAYLVMELVDGSDLARLVRHLGPLRAAEACEVGRQMAAALAAAHAVGAIHRDIKPSNAMIDRTGCVKLLDFGLACLTTTAGDQSETSVGRFLGTLEYMAPEQLERGAANTVRADLYGLGATLFFLLTGRPPHRVDEHGSVLEQLRAIAGAEAPRASSLRADIPAGLDQLVARLLTRDPASRPESASDVAAALATWAGGDLGGLVGDVPLLTEDAAEAERSLSQLLRSDHAPEMPNSARATERVTTLKILTGGHRRFTRLLAGALLAVALAALVWGVIILLETPEGTLRIESEVADVSVQLVDEHDARREWSVEQGENSTTLDVGRYRVRLAGRHDGLTIEPNAFVLRRGENVLARISRTGAPTAVASSPDNPAPVADGPIYQGQPESVWRSRFLSEQAPIPKLQAAEALIVLGFRLPEVQRLDRLLEIGGTILAAGWGDDPLLVPVRELAHQGQFEGARWPLDRDKELKSAFHEFVQLINAESEQLPAILVAKRLSSAILDRPLPEASFAAWLLWMRAIRGLREHTEAARVVMQTLDVPLEDDDRGMLAVLLRGYFYLHANDAQQQAFLDDFRQLAIALLEADGDVERRFRDAWIETAKLVPASEWAAKIIFAEALAGGVQAVRHRFPSDWFKPDMPYADQWAQHARKEIAYFINDWVSTVNDYLAENDAATIQTHLPAIVLSLDFTTRIHFEGDKWPLDKTAQLLLPLLETYYTAPEGPLVDKPPSELLAVSAGEMLAIIVRTTGEIPQLVREGRPRSTEVMERLNELKDGARLSDSKQFVRRARALGGLAWDAPFHSMRILIEEYDAVWFAGFSTPVHAWLQGRSKLDPLLQLAILSELTGVSDQQDALIASLLLDRSVSLQRDVEEIVTGPWAIQPHVRRTLQQMAQRAKAESLVKAVNELAPRSDVQRAARDSAETCRPELDISAPPQPAL